MTTTRTRPPLDARGLTKRYRRRAVLTDVSLHVAHGEAVAVIGENGAGKTTLLQLCAGLLAPDAGTVERHGRSATARRSPVSWTSSPRRSTCCCSARQRACPATRRAPTGRRLLDSFGFPAGETAVAKDLSGGTARSSTWRWPCSAIPSVLLLDEPYQGFDMGSYVDFWAHVDTWRDRGPRGGRRHPPAHRARPGRPGRRGSRRQRHELPRRWPHERCARRTFVVAELQARDLLRRRAVMALFVLLPAAFYYSSPPARTTASSPARSVCRGRSPPPGCSGSSAGGARTLGSRSPGARPGRACSVGCSCCRAGRGPRRAVRPTDPHVAIEPARRRNPRRWCSALVLMALVSVPLGLAIGALVPRELEGTLVLIGVVGVETSVPPTPAWPRRCPVGSAGGHADRCGLDRRTRHRRRRACRSLRAPAARRRRLVVGRPDGRRG
jgi:ABC-2 type transport system ATP-binding protein